MYKYSRYISRIARQPWAITPDRFAIIADLVRERAAGVRPSDEEIAARLGDVETQRAPVPASGAIAVLPIHGVIAHRADSFEASSGGTSTEVIGKLLQRLVSDESVNAILLDFDSPGGSVEGVPELAAQIAKATAVKPVIAHVNALAASAGYWLASQASEIVITPSGMVGSIGVFLLLVDESEALAKEGVKVNAISAGEFKLEGAPWEPLSDEARAHLQGQVDVVYRDFLSAVAKGRGVTVADVRKQYGQGRVYDAKEALARGMVDRIATVDETLARLMGGRQPTARVAEASTGQVLAAVEETLPDALSERVVGEAPAGTRLLGRLPLYTAALGEIGRITLTADLDGRGRLLGDWPPRAAFTVELLNHASEFGLVLDGDTIHITLTNASASYRAIGYLESRNEIIADREQWCITPTAAVAAEHAAILAALAE